MYDVSVKIVYNRPVNISFGGLLMKETLLKNIIDGVDVRQSLSSLRQELKDEILCSELAAEVANDPALIDLLSGLLSSDDAKTRKNVALLMGDLAIQDFCEPLFNAYEAETTMFVKSSYLNALKFLNYFAYMHNFKSRLEELSGIELTPENKKHTEEEMRALSELIVEMDGISKHEFSGWNKRFECILLTNRLHADITAEQVNNIPDSTAEVFNAGVIVNTKRISEVLALRTYTEILFVVPGMKSCEADPVSAASVIASSTLYDFMIDIHDGTEPFYFRTEIRSGMPLDKKSKFAKKFSSELERLSNRNLLNSPSNYEFEIRMIENKAGTFNLLVKLNTIPDQRFDYRQGFTATSIKPSAAALLVELAKDYMIDDAKVLDPFCGVGTMLIERQKVMRANTSYGLDIFSDAIDKARTNTEAAGQIIHYINRDFFDFKHEYLFDEIFTNMPFAIGHKSKEEIREIYQHFFETVSNFLTHDGTIIMYSHDRDYVKEFTKRYDFRIIKEFEIIKKDETYLFVIR